ncbi:MAG TPA: hypothetical protein VEX61_13455 [Burkholderiales bacterium]|nr:hypothetical protein [Burkholderiales bacterium]
MENDTQARVEHEIAELRGAFPRVTSCLSALRTWFEDGQPRHCLWLDIRWPEHQSILSGAACDSVEQALQAGFDKARAALGGCDA